MLGRLNSTIPNLQIYLPKNANSEKLGLGIDNPCRMVFFVFADEQVLGKGYSLAFLESLRLQLRNDTMMSPQLESFIFIVTSIVYGEDGRGGTAA